MLKANNIPFIARPMDVDEDAIIATSPKNFVYQATRLKMQKALKVLGSDQHILCADTVVTAQNRILRKAKTAQEARDILLTQSGHETSIITCSMLHLPHFDLIDISCTTYHFNSFNEEALNAYLTSGEWQGKAGACMVEGFCKPFIKKVEGLESNAMGLPIEKIVPYL
jgi:septum formation protein